jgi:hypothetical protein
MNMTFPNMDDKSNKKAKDAHPSRCSTPVDQERLLGISTLLDAGTSTDFKSVSSNPADECRRCRHQGQY